MANANIDNAKGHLQAAGQEAKREVKDRLEDVNDEYQEAKGKAKAKLGDATEKLQQGCDKVKDYVKKNPLTSLGIAAAVGLGVASLLNRNK